MPGVRRAIVVLALLLVASSCSSGADEGTTTGPPAPSSTTEPPAPGSTTSRPATTLPPSEVEAILADAGVRIISDPADSAGGLELWSFQVENMARELEGGGGYVGARLDELAGAPGGLPFSYLLAGWLSSAPTPTAQAAAGIMGDQPWEEAQALIYPTVVLVMFVADAVEAGGGARDVAMARAVPVSLAQAGVCSTLSGWVNEALDYLFNALKIETDDDGFLGWLAGIWNAAVDLARDAIGGLIEALTAPIVALIADGLAVIGTLNMIVSLLKPWDLDLTPSNASTRFAVGDEADIAETFTAEVDTGIDFEWPAMLVDCAQVAGLELPDPRSAEGSRVNWDVVGLPPLGDVTSMGSSIDSENKSRLEWVTGREDSDRGPTSSGTVTATARVVSKQIEKLKAMLEQLIADQIPVAPFGDVVSALFSSLTAPVFDLLAELVQVSGSSSVTVTYHGDDEDPSSGAQAPIMGWAWEMKGTSTWGHRDDGTAFVRRVTLRFEFADDQELDDPVPRYRAVGGTVVIEAVDMADTHGCTYSAGEVTYELTPELIPNRVIELAPQYNPTGKQFAWNYLYFDTTADPITYWGNIYTEPGAPEVHTTDCPLSGANDVDVTSDILWIGLAPRYATPITGPGSITGSEQSGTGGYVDKTWTITRVE